MSEYTENLKKAREYQSRFNWKLRLENDKDTGEDIILAYDGDGRVIDWFEVLEPDDIPHSKDLALIQLSLGEIEAENFINSAYD